MDELESRMQRVLDAARQGMTPSAVDTERTRRVLLAASAGLAVGVGAGTAAAAGAGASGAAGASAATAAKATGLFAAISSLSMGTKMVAAVAVSASIGTAGIIATQSERAASKPATTVIAPAKAPVAPALAVAPPQAQLEVAPEPEPTPKLAPRLGTAMLDKALDPDPLSAELALIERARQALKNDLPQQALAALDEHRSRFEHGVMTQERVALRALALCSLGDPKGPEEAQRFLTRNPGSPLASHLRSGCK